MICDEFSYYDNNQEEIVRNHIDEFVVIKNRQICGYYKLEMDAFKSMAGMDFPRFYGQKIKPLSIFDMLLV